MANYFRITGYSKENDFCFVIDSYGAYEKLWQFSAFMVGKKLEVVEVGNSDRFLDGDLPKISETSDKPILRAHSEGSPQKTQTVVDGISYLAVRVGDKTYIPDRTVIK